MSKVREPGVEAIGVLCLCGLLGTHVLPGYILHRKQVLAHSPMVGDTPGNFHIPNLISCTMYNDHTDTPIIGMDSSSYRILIILSLAPLGSHHNT